MPIIGNVGRRSFKVRTLNSVIHIVLLIGSITMIYPFMIMISASFKSRLDEKEFSTIPKYFYNEEMLFKKYIESRLNEESTYLTKQYKNKFISFDFVKKPKSFNKSMSEDWNRFVEENVDNYGIYDYSISEQFSTGVYPKNERKFRSIIKEESDKKIDNFNKQYGTGITSWEQILVEEKDVLSKNFNGNYEGFLARYKKFRATLLNDEKEFASLDGHFIYNELIPAFRGDLALMNKELGTNYPTWNHVIVPKSIPENSLKEYWIHYVKNVLNISHLKVSENSLNEYQNFLNEKYSSIDLLNKTYKKDFASFTQITIPNSKILKDAELVDWTFFIEKIANPEDIKITSYEIDYRNWLKQKYGNIESLNKKYNLGYSSFNEVYLPQSMPEENVLLQEKWKSFVQENASKEYLSLSANAKFDFQKFIKEKFNKNNEIDLKLMNESLGTNFSSTYDIFPSKTLPNNASYKEIWLEFLNEVNPKFIEISDKESENWQNYLKSNYVSISDYNERLGYVFTDFETFVPSKLQLDYQLFLKNKKAIFKEFLSRNYIKVLDVMLYNGRAVTNTLIYCLLAILTAIIVNPLAAYALSRFNLPSSYKIILVMMLTMAFPPMVMGIPNFLILKNLNMLNTFWALILPGAADGYFIFLLKGFFDSLPKELFESATLDGAPERTIFFRIAMALSKPIMAVIALGAFNAAYRNFMFAFIVCQDQKMWTMMVHIYQLMQRSSDGVGFAALVIAAIPTFFVFVFFQNVIIRGIVVPTEK